MSTNKPRIQDIASAVGVSKTTVSRYLNGKFEFMSGETKKRIEDEIAKTGYRPNRLANSLKTKRSGLIGLVMSNVMSNQSPQLLGSVCDTCAEYGKKIIIVNSEKDPEKEKSLVYELLDQRVEGLLVVSGYNIDFYRKLDREELPVVLADRVSGNADMDSVTINHAESTRKVINHLLGKGFENIVILKRNHKNPNNTPMIRVRAAEQACFEFFGDTEHSRTVTIDYEPKSEETSEKFIELTEVLQDCYRKSEKRRTAVFIAEQALMELVVCSYYSAKLQITDRFTMAGYCEWGMTNMIIPQISTIEQPIERMGQLATKRLIERIENNAPVQEASLLSCRVKLA